MVAEIGRPLHWERPEACFDAWKEIRPNLHVAEKPYLDDYPGSFFYIAAEWAGRDDECLVVLTKCH